MDFRRIIKNALVVNPVISRLFNIFRETTVYKSMVRSAVRVTSARILRDKEFIVQIETTNICNAKCGFCPYVGMERGKGIMTDAIFNMIVRRLIAEDIHPFGFNVNGTGEPLVDKAIFKRIRILRDHFPDAIIKFHSNFNLATSDSMIELIQSGLSEINISFNGYNVAVYEEVMKIKYEKTLENIKHLLVLRKASGSPLKVRISMVLVAGNESHEREFLDYWQSKVDSVSINRPHDYSGKAQDLAGQNKVSYDTWHVPCKSLWGTITIGYNGDLLLCCLDHEGNHGLGNIMESGILELFYQRKLQELREKHLTGDLESAPMCRDCGVPHESGLTWFVKKAI